MHSKIEAISGDIERDSSCMWLCDLVPKKQPKNLHYNNIHTLVSFRFILPKQTGDSAIGGQVKHLGWSILSAFFDNFQYVPSCFLFRPK